MIWKLRKKRTFALTGNFRSTILAEITRTPSGSPSFRLLAETEGPITGEVTIPRLLAAATEPLQGEISIVLPLAFFEIVSVSLPIMPEETVGQALPYHLAKVIPKSLSEYIYDWQINKRHRDRLDITVFLFPAGLFEHIRKEFLRRQVAVVSLEADVFAAFGFLEGLDRLKADATTLCAIIWPENISFAVYEDPRLSLVRTVAISCPDTPYEGLEHEAGTVAHEETHPAAGTDFAGDPGPAEEAAQAGDSLLLTADVDTTSILAGFDLFSNQSGLETADNTIEASVSAPDPASSQTADSPWRNYLQKINLEIMRTRDFHASVLKGNAIKNVMIGGAETFWDAFQKLTADSLDIDMELLASASPVAECSPAFNALCLGTAIRR